MSAIRSRDNRTELSLRRALHSLGLRYRLHPAAVLGKPDIVFVRERVAVFVDGDYWHARLLREQGLDALTSRLPEDGKDYWITKFTRRVVRDDAVNATLTYQGWLVLRFWEGDIRRDVMPTAKLIDQAVRLRRVSKG
jgi:DNA mismatch endonuclease (patch repair protein)